MHECAAHSGKSMYVPMHECAAHTGNFALRGTDQRSNGVFVPELCITWKGVFVRELCMRRD